ncbi:hypothetical protein F4803DRAFT_557605 [Xylaria telfairii]|nr:hypothetical protein F4803DRAFT_557605 [Xylaria telfairii]
MDLGSVITTKPKLTEKVIANVPLSKTPQFTFAKNWSNHGSISFDNPDFCLTPSHYERQAKIINHSTDPGSNFSLEKLMGKIKSNGGKILSSGPDLSPGIPGMTAFLRAAGVGDLKTPVTVPDFIEKVIRGASTGGSSGIKTEIIESGLTTDGSSSSPEHGAVCKPTGIKLPVEIYSGPNPAIVTQPSSKVGHTKLKSLIEQPRKEGTLGSPVESEGLNTMSLEGKSLQVL